MHKWLFYIYHPRLWELSDGFYHAGKHSQVCVCTAGRTPLSINTASNRRSSVSLCAQMSWVYHVHTSMFDLPSFNSGKSDIKEQQLTWRWVWTCPPGGSGLELQPTGGDAWNLKLQVLCPVRDSQTPQEGCGLARCWLAQTRVRKKLRPAAEASGAALLCGSQT